MGQKIQRGGGGLSCSTTSKANLRDLEHIPLKSGAPGRRRSGNLSKTTTVGWLYAPQKVRLSFHQETRSGGKPTPTAIEKPTAPNPSGY